MRYSGKIGSVVAVSIVGILAFVLFLGLALFGWYRSGYNKAATLDEAVDAAWGNVEDQLQRRFDLIPNLVETVKGYATQEKELFENIARSREKYFQAGSTASKVQAANRVEGFLSRLLVLQERYPELKSNQNFLALQDQLEGTENRISVARTRYNEAVRALNTFRRRLFGSFFCNQVGAEAREYFEASEQAQTEVPQVNFSTPQPEASPQ